MISYKKNFKEYISYYNLNTLESRTDKLMEGVCVKYIQKET